MKTVTFDFEVGQSVKLTALNIKCLVRACCVGANAAKEYRVAYYFNGQRFENWVFADELERVTG